jgi:hypothetical protein
MWDGVAPKVDGPREDAREALDGASPSAMLSSSPMAVPPLFPEPSERPK